MVKGRRFSIGLALWLFCPALWVSEGYPQSAQVTQGHQIADQMCAQCHRMGRGSGSWTDAPPFEAVATTTSMNQTQLTDFIMQPHFDMVARNLSRTRAGEIAAYILSLRSER